MPGPNDALGQVRLLDYLLSGEDGRYRLLVADSFEGRPWAARAASNPLAQVSYIYKTPDNEAFKREQSLLETYTRDGFRQSLFIHTSFETPGRESFWIRPATPVKLEGQLLRCSLWVHSEGYLHTLVLLFRNADGQKVNVDLGGLHWKGWRRIDVQLPPALFRRGRGATNRYTHQLTGILIRSHPLSEPGDVALMLDHLLVVSDVAEFRYPGFEYRDAW